MKKKIEIGIKEHTLVSIPAAITELAGLRDQMIRRAMKDIGCDEHLAEDVVQEALEDAITDLQKFKGESNLKTWAFNILKYKIIDQIRRKYRHPSASDMPSKDEPDDNLEDYFDEKGGWRAHILTESWDSPEKLLERWQLGQIIEDCIGRLSKNVARVFRLTEKYELSTDEVCEITGLTDNNCAQQRFRARRQLMSCLEQKGIGVNG